MNNLKSKDLRKCCHCDKGVLHSGNLTFYQVGLSNYVANMRGIQELHGLEQMMGGGQFGVCMANVLGSDPDLAMQLDEAYVLVCMNCVYKVSVATIHEHIIDHYEELIAAGHAKKVEPPHTGG